MISREDAYHGSTYLSASASGKTRDKNSQELGLMVRPLVNMCVMSPPLIISKEQIDDMVGMLRE